MRPFSLNPTLLLLVELKCLRLKTLTSPRPQHGGSECVSDSCLPINEGSVAVEGYDPGWFQAALNPRFVIYPCLLVVGSSSGISADSRGYGTGVVLCFGSCLQDLRHSRIALR